MTTDVEQKRRTVLKLIREHERSDDPTVIRSSDIADRLGTNVLEIDLVLEELEDIGLVELVKLGAEDFGAQLTPEGKRYLALESKPQPETPQINIGAIVNSDQSAVMGFAGSTVEEAEITQSLGVTEDIERQLTDIETRLIEAVRHDLNASELKEYIQSIDELRSELHEQRPRKSRLKSLFRILEFGDTVEGVTSLLERVRPALDDLMRIIERFVGDLGV